MGLTMYCMATKGSSKEVRLMIKREVVMYAQREGIKPTTRRFGVARNTIRRWKARFEESGYKGLEDGRKGPELIPHKTSQSTEDHIIACRSQSPFLGARRLKDIYNLSSSIGAIHRILKVNGLTRKKRKKYQKKNDLREVKAKYKALSYLQYDVKHLYDISNFWIQLQTLDLPRYEYTIRDVKTGWVFLGYSNELSELNSRVFMDLVLTQLKATLLLKGEEITIQTDNGVEFSGSAKKFEKATFSKVLTDLHGIKHIYIPPGCCNANADVESFHQTVEIEFFDYENFRSRELFFNKANTYQLWYNMHRKNYSKKCRTPLEIAELELKNPERLSFISVVDLDKLSNVTSEMRGQSFPVFPDHCQRDRHLGR